MPDYPQGDSNPCPQVENLQPRAVSAETTTTYDRHKQRDSANDSTHNQNDSTTHAEPDPVRATLLRALEAMPGADLSELTDIVTAWPSLPEAIRAGVVAMIRATAR